MKTYVFGIGGTGARVIKALTMLLSAGVEIDTNEIVPVFIDPDKSAANLTEAVDLLRTYKEINEELSFGNNVQNRFFQTEVNEMVSQFLWNLATPQNNQFEQYLALGSLSGPNEALVRMLFSEKNLEMNMDEGFRGNPNVGSVVLNQFTQSEDFQTLANGFVAGDRIFIISSIFGGTGASGFPLLLKNLRGINPNMPNANAIQNAPIGAITVMPYFNLTSAPGGQGNIDPSTFVTKTKAALKYYAANVSGNKSLNAMYYIGDDQTAQYAYCEGGTGQKNKANLIELLAALAVVDFCNLPNNKVTCNGGQAINPIYKEFGVQSNDGTMGFPGFYNGTRQLLQKPMTQFTLMCKYLKEQREDSMNQVWARGKSSLNASFFNKNTFFENINKVNKEYMQWLEEMGNNSPAFRPFLLAGGKNDVFGLVNGVQPHKKVFSLKNNYALFDDYLNKTEPQIDNGLKVEERFMELFYRVTEKLVNDKKLA